MYGDGGSNGHFNPSIIGEQIPTVQNKCTIDLTIESIQIGAKTGINN